MKVSCYELQYDGNGKLNNAVAQAQMQHDAPVLCTDIANVNDTFSTNIANYIQFEFYTHYFCMYYLSCHTAFELGCRVGVLMFAYQ
jgi:hypothetical protein